MVLSTYFADGNTLSESNSTLIRSLSMDPGIRTATGSSPGSR
jgi:hypothetical protein